VRVAGGFITRRECHRESKQCTNVLWSDLGFVFSYCVDSLERDCPVFGGARYTVPLRLMPFPSASLVLACCSGPQAEERHEGETSNE